MRNKMNMIGRYVFETIQVLLFFGLVIIALGLGAVL